MLIRNKNFIKQAKKLKAQFASGVDALEIANGIADREQLEVFYASRLVLELGRDSIDSVFEAINTKFTDDKDIIKADCIKEILMITNDLRSRCNDSLKGVDVVALMNEFEKALKLLDGEGISYNGLKYNKAIASSMYGHLVEVYSILPKFLKHIRKDIFTSYRKIKLNGIQVFIMILSQYVANRSMLIDILYGEYEVRSGSMISINMSNMVGIEPEQGGNLKNNVSLHSKYCLYIASENWRLLEICRDLCYKFLCNNEKDIDKLMDIMVTSGALRSYDDGSIFHINMDRENDFYEAMYKNRNEKMLQDIYGDLNSKFTYNSIVYAIQERVDLFHKIRLFSRNKEFRSKNSKINIKSYLYGRREFKRKARLTDREGGLVDLFCFDYQSDNGFNEASYLLIRDGEKIYHCTTLVFRNSCEKVIDRILSSKDVSVSIEGKGILFENSVREILIKCGYSAININSYDQIRSLPKKDKPEIDILFFADDNFIFVGEAKCSIKPESREEARTFLENHLLKAVDQINIRIKFVCENLHHMGKILFRLLLQITPISVE